jgi:hypothetical protein
MPSLAPESRGFVGRPLIALLFAVAMGSLGYHLGTWTHLNGLAVLVIIVATIGIVGYVWHRAEKLK